MCLVRLRGFQVAVDLAQPEVGMGTELPIGEIIQVTLEGFCRRIKVSLDQLVLGGTIGVTVCFGVIGRRTVGYAAGQFDVREIFAIEPIG